MERRIGTERMERRADTGGADGRAGAGAETRAATGRAGERAATEHLRHAGYDIRALNWRQGIYELDIVAAHRGILHFVEVKTRQAGALTPPEAALTRRKCQALSRAAAAYLRAVRWDGEVQFDLAKVEMAEDGAAHVELIENALEFNW
ncbi:YraN family protein [uncultured Alistipes sp.]|uniref:YraN family protein n=1 Tax=uncultured Alistipes sp. TaxID=538949 RepID=UPI00261DAC81|nr:YraN family protein [uncultured Alistipes sp.]